MHLSIHSSSLLAATSQVKVTLVLEPKTFILTTELQCSSENDVNNRGIVAFSQVALFCGFEEKKQNSSVQSTFTLILGQVIWIKWALKIER